MTQAKQPEAIKLASEYRETMPADVLHLWAGEVVGELRRLHAENATLRSGYDASRLDIESLRARVQELGQMLRENRSKRIVELEAQLEAIGAGGVEPLRRRDHFRDATEMVPLTDRAIQAARTADYDVEDAPENWAFALGVRFAERAHGITQEQA